MRKPVLYGLIAVIAVLVGTVGVLFGRYRNVRTAEEATRARYVETIDAIAEIQDSLSAIALGDTSVNVRDMQAQQELTRPNSQEALDRIATLRASIDRSKELIRELEAKMQKDGIRINGLERMVARLKRNVTEKETYIATLTTRVDSLQTEVTGLATVVQQNEDSLRVREAALEERRRELATIFYVVGSKKDLKDQGVVEAKGGVLGLGKTLTPTGNVAASFIALDTDEETVVRTAAKEAKVLSAQPPTSYELVLVNGEMELHILNPTEFRKVKQLVIMTTA